MSNFWHKRSFAELSTEPSDLAKRGLVFLMAEFFTVPQSGSVSFALTTNGVEVEFQFYELSTDESTIRAVLVEDPTATKFGSLIPARNLKRTSADDHTVELQSASAVSGGTVVASELFGGRKAAGAASSDKVHTLKNETLYVMTFHNTDNQSALCHINLGWAENEPEHYDLVTEGINAGGVT